MPHCLPRYCLPPATGMHPTCHTRSRAVTKPCSAGGAPKLRSQPTHRVWPSRRGLGAGFPLPGHVMPDVVDGVVKSLSVPSARACDAQHQALHLTLAGEGHGRVRLGGRLELVVPWIAPPINRGKPKEKGEHPLGTHVHSPTESAGEKTGSRSAYGRWWCS